MSFRSSSSTALPDSLPFFNKTDGEQNPGGAGAPWARRAADSGARHERPVRYEHL